MTEETYLRDGVHVGISVTAMVRFITKVGEVQHWLMTESYPACPTKAKVLADAIATTGCSNTVIVNMQCVRSKYVHKTAGCDKPNF
jgi:hypothetical protein